MNLFKTNGNDDNEDSYNFLHFVKVSILFIGENLTGYPVFIVYEENKLQRIKKERIIRHGKQENIHV